jgi:membrane-associated phospholipid phosphatase
LGSRWLLRVLLPSQIHSRILLEDHDQVCMIFFRVLNIDFLDRCQPLLTATNPTAFTLSNSTVCTRTSLLKDGYRSFPSGHSSSMHLNEYLLILVSFSGLGFLALFIAGRLNVLDTRGQVWKTILALIPLVGAGIIASSRLIDNRYLLKLPLLISDIIHLM